MKILRLFIAFTLVCFALSRRVQSVVPPPPGGYPNFTTAAGDHALQALTLGLGNTAIGTFSLSSVTTGSFNTAVGAGALDFNTADSNTATGAAALLFNTTGTENTANGTAALEFNDSGSFNAAVGADALGSNIDGTDNNAVGDSALANNTTGRFNEAIGSFALASNVEGVANVAIGDTALNNAGSSFNTVVGYSSGQNVIAGGENIYLGDSAGTLDNLGASPGDETGVIRIGSVFSGTAACFINGIATNLQVWNGVTVCQVTVNGFGQLGVDCVNPDNPRAVPQRPQAQAMLNGKVEKLEATVAQQQKEIEALTAGLQKVSAQLELSKSAPQTVLNDQ